MNKVKTINRKLLLIYVWGIILFLVLVTGKLVYLMVFKSQYYTKRAVEVQERERRIKAPRGEILDRNGKVIASNKTVCTVSVIYNQIKEPEKIKDMLKEIITEMLGEDQKLDMSTTPSVILVIGVNGVGKTTTIGKLAYQLHKQGKKVIVAAADTFRAAAIDQLEVWTERAGVDIIKHNEGSDPASVVFDALVAAKARQADVVICDTAGRLHNKKNLMDELKKISRIVHQQAEGCALEVLLALDATTGQNAVNQARLFNEVADITGIILTKLDGTAKGGIIISITDDLQVPVKLVTVGEKIDDIQPFSARDFVEALFE